MKLKDIEKNLKKEQSEVKVPNVFARVKQAPINRLLTPPQQAFQKKLAVRLLTLAFVLFLVATFTLVTMLLVPTKTSDDLCYIAITIDGDQDVLQVGLIARGSRVYCAVIEQENDDVLAVLVPTSDDLQNAISALYQSKTNDNVSFCVICDKNENEGKIATEVYDALAQNYRGKDNFTINARTNRAETKTRLLQFLLSVGVETSQGDSVDMLCIAYINALNA